MRSMTTTDAALVSIVKKQRYVVLDCLDKVVSHTRDDYYAHFETVDDLINANIDRVVEAVCEYSIKFDRTMVERFRSNVSIGWWIANSAVNTDSVRARSEARKLIEVLKILGRIMMELDNRVE